MALATASGWVMLLQLAVHGHGDRARGLDGLARLAGHQNQPWIPSRACG
jgi:hypothetical protein